MVGLITIVSLVGILLMVGWLGGWLFGQLADAMFICCLVHLLPGSFVGWDLVSGLLVSWLIFWLVVYSIVWLIVV